MPGAYRHPEHLTIETYGAGDFSLMEQLQEAVQYTKKEQLLESLETVDETLYAQIDARLQSTYPYEEEVNLRTKVSVSELKHRNMVLEPGDEEALAVPLVLPFQQSVVGLAAEHVMSSSWHYK